MSNLEAALEYRDKYNFSVIPIVPGEKRAMVKWEEYQKRHASTDEIKAWFRKEPNANLAIVTGAISNLTVIDIDSAEGKSNIAALLPQDFNAPVVHTPRGGFHLYCIYNNLLNNNTNLIKGSDLRSEGGYVLAPLSSNAEGKPYHWDTKKNLENTQLQNIPDSYVDAIMSSDCRQSVVKSRHLSSSVVMFREGSRDNDLFHVANCLAKSRMPYEEISQVLQILAANCDPPFSQKEIQLKIKSAIDRCAKRERNLTEEVREWILSSSGVFLSSDVVKCLQVSSRDDQKNISKALGRIAKEGMIEKCGDRNGCYRIVDTEENEIDIFGADVTPMKIKWPLGVENFVATHPKQLIVIAGEVNSGKSAYLLNVARMNMHKFPTYYFSSEMGAVELKTRLEKFDMPYDEWRKVKFIDRAGNFADKIRPDGLNIIDFLEVHDEFYKVGGMLKQIFDKLENGIAVIAMQKPKGRDEALGGERSLEKPRLYMSMSPGELKIVKGKNWVSENINPNGMTVNWKLVNGCKFTQVGNWHV